MEILAKINLDDIRSGDDWGTSIGEIVKDELKAAIKFEVRKAIKNDPSLKKVVKALQKKAAEQIVRL